MPVRTVFLLALLISLPACRHLSDTPPIDPQIAQQLLQLHNRARRDGVDCNGAKLTAGELIWNLELARIAARHSRGMRKNNRLSHRSSNGWSAKKRINKSKYEWRAFAENLARGDDLRTVFDGWITSDSHCTNILNPVYQEMGGAMIDGYWTVLLARPKSSR